MQPVKKQLRKFVSLCDRNDEYDRRLNNLILASKSEQWKTVIEILWSIKNEMAIELLQDRKFIEKTEAEKDITQRVYHNISEWIDFLTNPRVWVQKKGMIQNLKSKLTVKKAERKDVKDGKTGHRAA